MSGLYNTVFGVNPLAGVLLPLVGVTQEMCGRFRDCYLYEPEDQMCIQLVTRNGGPNRAEFAGNHLVLEKVRGYMHDEDAPNDPTYRLYYYEIPERAMEALEGIIEVQPDVVIRKTFAQRWDDILKSMSSGKPSPEAIQAMERVKSTIDKIRKAFEGGANVVAALDKDRGGVEPIG